jgi:hypothetical protein
MEMKDRRTVNINRNKSCKTWTRIRWGPMRISAKVTLACIHAKCNSSLGSAIIYREDLQRFCNMLPKIWYFLESVPDRGGRSGERGHCHPDNIRQAMLTCRVSSYPAHHRRTLRLRCARPGKLAPLGLTLCTGHKCVCHDLVAGHHTAVVAAALGEMGAHFVGVLSL